MENLVSRDDNAPPESGLCALPRAFFRRHPTVVAPELLNKILVRDDGRAGRIVEVEAYAGTEDPAAHSFRGKTARNATMFGEPGHLYVYLSYGLHWCSNAVCGDIGQGCGVLLRALEPLHGLDLIRRARPAIRRDHQLAAGPGRLSQAMRIDRTQDGADLVTNDRGVSIVSDGTVPPGEPVIGPRIGISRATDFPWRWHIPGNRHVSVRAPVSRRRKPED